MPERVCPWWMGYLLACPIRRFFESPEKIVAPYVRPGMTVLEIGPGMGFFTIPMARFVGESGKNICVDIQQKMLDGLMSRARRAKIADRVVPRLSSPESFNIADFSGQIEFVLLMAVVHEVPNQKILFEQVYRAMKPGATMLIAEPGGHVTKEGFSKMVEVTKSLGFEEVSRPKISRNISILLKKV